MMLWRKEKEANYQAFFNGSMTTRIPLDASKPITELRYPEAYDVGLGTRCDAGCPNCYTSAVKTGINFMDPAQKILDLWGPMDRAKRPFQVAIGGSGEPLEHPQLAKVLQVFRELGITPNYTTNGRYWYRPGVLEATVRYAGGVAVSCHPHMVQDWTRAITEYLKVGVKLNLHVIISDQKSCERFERIWNEYKDVVDYIVILPLIQVGRGARFPEMDKEAMARALVGKDTSKLAFGANLYSWLQEHREIPVNLYPPEIMTKYILLDSIVTVYNNSHEMRKRLSLFAGKPLPPIPLAHEAEIPVAPPKTPVMVPAGFSPWA